MSTGLFSGEEDGYNIEDKLEETKYVLKGSAPSSDSSIVPTEEPIGDVPMDDLEGLEDAPAEDKPFDDEPFDAGVDADEDTDPAKYIQQLSGKLGQSLRQYSKDEGQSDFDLEKFAVNSVLSATHTGEMDKEDQRDIINKVKSAGLKDSEDMEAESEVDAEPEVDVEEKLDVSDESVKEIVEELPLSKGDGGCGSVVITPTSDGIVMDPIDNDAFRRLKDVAELKESKLNRIFVDKTKLIKDLRLMENVEPMIEPQVVPKTPLVRPSKPQREVDRPFSPKRRVDVQPDPKAKKYDK